MGTGDWPCCGIDKNVSLTGPQPWDVVCKNKHHPECVVLPTTLGNVPVMPRYYCRGRSHDITLLYLAGTVVFYEEGYCFESRKLVTLWNSIRPDIYLYLGMYVHLYYFICMLLFFIYIYLCSE